MKPETRLTLITLEPIVPRREVDQLTMSVSGDANLAVARLRMAGDGIGE